jgi:hypothetical protein
VIETEHAIETEPDKKPPHRPLYQLSPAGLRAAKEYIVELVNQGKVRSRKSPYGSQLFFVKDGDKRLRGLVDYRALNLITMRNMHLFHDQMKCSIGSKAHEYFPSWT